MANTLPQAESAALAAARRARRLPAVAPHVVLAAVAFGGYAVLEIARYLRFAQMSWDLAIFVQEVRGYAALHAPVADIKGPGFNILGDHFSPIVAVLAPLYRAFPSAVTLLVAQSLLFAVSVGIVSATAARFLGRARGLAVGVAYGASWGLLNAVDFDFHEICFAVPLIALVLRALLLEKWTAAALWSLPLLLVKEDLGLTVAAVGVLIAARGRDDFRARATGAGLALIGAGALLLTVFVLIPHFNAGGEYPYWNKLPGDGTSGTGPLTLFQHLVWPSVKLTTLAWTAGITGFLALRSPLVLLAVPTLLWRFASNNDMYWGRSWHYSAILMPVVFLALVDGVLRAEGSRFAALRGYARAVVPAAAGIAAALSLTSPLHSLTDPATYRIGTHGAAANRAVAAVPRGATVESDITLLSHLAARDDVYWVGGSTRTPPQYLALDLSSGWSPGPPSDLPGYARRLHPGTRWTVVFHQDGLAVLKRASG